MTMKRSVMVLAEFAKGSAAMAIHGDWLVPQALTIDETLAEKVGLVAIPLSDDASKNKLVIFYNDGYSIFKAGENVEEATEFFDYFFTNESQNLLAKETGGTVLS